MIIKRFKAFPKKNEDMILEECGFPDSTPYYELQPFYNGDNNLAFLFSEADSESGFTWLDKQDEFSLLVYETYRYKSALVEELKGKEVAVFLLIDKVYQFYGVFKLSNPFVAPGGIGMVVNTETPLVFILDKEDLVIE